MGSFNPNLKTCSLSATKLISEFKMKEKQIFPFMGGRITEKIIFLFLNLNICCGCSKEPSQRDGSFEHPKHKLKLMGKKVFIILR